MDFEQDIIEQAKEFLVDVYEAEIYLREKEKMSGKDADQELRKVFGGEIIDGARVYVQAWIDEAAKTLEEQLIPTRGPEQAHAIAETHKQKWLDNPFGHRVTLTDLPEFKLSGRKVG